MTKARFFIKDKPLQGLRGRGAEPHMVQEVGYRVHISPYRACGVVGQSPTMQKILNSGLNGTVINLADGRVEVRLEGEKERIEEFYEELSNLLEKGLIQNHTFRKGVYQKLGGRVDKGGMAPYLEFNANLMVPDSMRSSQALILEQLSKGIVYAGGMKESMDGMKGEMREGFKALPKEIAKELKDLLEGKIRK